MKKWFAALLLIALTLTFVACAKSENTTGANDNNASDNDDVPKTYTVSGAWELNEILTFPQLTEEEHSRDIIQQISFTSSGKQFDDEIRVHGEWYDGTTIFGMFYDSTTAKAELVYESYETPVKWADESYRTIDFGEKTQEVNREFYEWLTENAKQISK